MKKQKKKICVYNFVNYCRFVNASAPPCYKLIPCKWIWWETKYNMYMEGFSPLAASVLSKFSSSHFTYSWCGEWWPYFSCQIVAFVSVTIIVMGSIYMPLCASFWNGKQVGEKGTHHLSRMPIVQPWLDLNINLHKNLTKTTNSQL